MARPTRRTGNLPAEATSFVGRRREIAELRKKLTTARLVSLVGPGGVGKTRLAIRGATDLARGFAAGAWMVELADVRDPDLVPNALLAALDLRDQTAMEPLDLLLSYLRDKQLLLVIDNCEHLLGAASKLVSEVMDVSQIDVIGRYCDIYQVGARNMQNFTLLRELGYVRKPVLLKRGISATIEEWLLSAEYVLSGGNDEVILCERGIRTFETATRNTFDISAIPVVRKLSHLPIIADPSHGAGRRDMVVPMARAAVAAGADGLLIEVHCDPDHALSDGAQSMFPSQFDRLMAELRIIAPAIGRSICLETVARRGWGS